MVTRKKVLILGGEGFIGRNLSDVLSKEYDCFSIGLKESIFSGSKAAFIKVDPYREQILGHYDVVIQLIDHKAPLEDVQKSEQKILDDLSSIMPEQLIVFSTAAIYMSPDSEYAKRKLLIEDIYQKYCQNKKIGLSILRLFNIYGPYQLPARPGSLVANLISSYFTKEPVGINDFDAVRDFIYAPDMAKCVEVIIKRQIYGQDDLATNTMTSIGELIAQLNQLLPDEIKTIDKNNKEAKCPNATSQIIKQIQITPMDQSLKETTEFYRDNWQLIKTK